MGQGLLIGVIGVSGAQDIEVPGAWVHWVGTYLVQVRSDGTRPLLRKLQVELLRSFLLGLEVTRRRPGAKLGSFFW